MFVREAVGHRIAGVVPETVGGSARIDRLALGVLRATTCNVLLEAEAGIAPVGRAGIVALAVLYGLGADGIDTVETMSRISIAVVERVANGVVSAASGFAGNADRGLAVPAALRGGSAATRVTAKRASLTRSLEADLARRATIAVTNNLPRRAMATGIVAALAIRGIATGNALIAAGGAALGQRARAYAR